MDNIKLTTHFEAAAVIFVFTFASSFLGTGTGTEFVSAHPYVKDIIGAAFTAYTATKVYLGAKPTQPEGPAKEQ